MIRFSGTIELHQLRVDRCESRIARSGSETGGFVGSCDRITETPGFGISRGQSPQCHRILILSLLTRFLGKSDSIGSISHRIIRGSCQDPRQIIQNLDREGSNDQCAAIFNDCFTIFS